MCSGSDWSDESENRTVAEWSGAEETEREIVTERFKNDKLRQIKQSHLDKRGHISSNPTPFVRCLRCQLAAYIFIFYSPQQNSKICTIH